MLAHSRCTLTLTRLASSLLLIFLLLALTAADLPPTPSLGDAPLAPAPPNTSQTHRLQPAFVRTQKLYIPMVQAAASTGLDLQSRDSSLAFYRTQYMADTPPANWTGLTTLCGPGSTSAAFKEAVLRRINYYRQMAGVPAVKQLNAEYTYKAQAAAALMSVNQALDHTPPTSWNCYSEAGAQGAGSSNLALGAYGPDAIDLYMDDPGGNNAPVGHRRWILYPQTQEMGTGDIPTDNWRSTSNALYVFDSHMWEPRPATRSPFVAWPPAGYVPRTVIYPRWSFSYPGADFSAAGVTVRANGDALPLTRHEPYNGFGENTLVWEFDNSAPWNQGGDRAFEVTIYNVLVEGQPQTFTYTVIAFEP